MFAAGTWRGLHSVGVVDSIEALNGIGHAAVMGDPGFRNALAGHGYTLDDSGEVEQLAPHAAGFSHRANQITRNVDQLPRADPPGPSRVRRPEDRPPPKAADEPGPTIPR